MNPYLYDNTVSQSIANGASAALLSIQIPSMQYFKLTGFANFVSNAGAWGSVYWTIDVNGILVPYFANIYDQLGLQNRPFEVNYDIQAWGMINFKAYNNYTVAVGFGIRVIGEFI